MSNIQGRIYHVAKLVGHVAIGSMSDDGTQTYILIDEDGNEIPAVLVDREVTLTATANDIRIGTTAVTDTGVTEGTKVIPSYHTTFGYKIIPNGSRFVLHIQNYEYTKLQAMFCPYNTSIEASTAVDRVVIEDTVYNVQSTEVKSIVTIDTANDCIDFGIVNTSGKPYILRYSSYKEIY